MQLHLAKFDVLMDLCRNKERRIGSVIKNIAITALCTVFKDIIPSLALTSHMIVSIFNIFMPQVPHSRAD